jgi:HEAT repeat protein
MKKLMVIAALIVVSAGVSAQSQPPAKRPGAMPTDQATQITQGWAFLAQGLLDDAERTADAALRVDALNPAALSLAIEVSIARAGATSALDRYEQWLGARAVESPYVLRRVARAVLWEAARSESTTARADALQALVADGDAEAAVELSAGLAQGNAVDVATMAKLGSEEAVRKVMADLATNPPNALALVRAISASKRPEAAPSLVALLGDARIDVRAEAALGLGRLGNRVAIAALKPLLTDTYPLVRLNAAASLALLDDSSGSAVLREFEDSEHDGVRIGAVIAMAARPDASWQGRVRQLMDSQDPVVSIDAAVLLAPHDPQAARAVMERYRGSSNPAVREAAERALSGEIANDFPTLRTYLRAGDSALRVKAGSRILTLAR